MGGGSPLEFVGGMLAGRGALCGRLRIYDASVLETQGLCWVRRHEPSARVRCVRPLPLGTVSPGEGKTKRIP